MGDRRFFLSLTIGFLVFSAQVSAVETVIYDNTIEQSIWYPPGSGIPVIDYGTVSAARVTRIEFAYITQLVDPGTITIKFYRDTDFDTCPGNLLKTLQFSNLDGSPDFNPYAFYKDYTLTEQERFNLPYGELGYLFEFSNDYTGVLLAKGGQNNENYFWEYDSYDGLWERWYFDAGGNPWAGFYMKMFTGSELLPDDPNTCIIEGYKFDDTNADGDWDGGEPGLPDWEIYLDINDNDVRDAGEPNMMTDSNGYYRFLNVNADEGPYTVAEVMKPGWSQTMPGGDGTYPIDPDPNGFYKNLNFGNTDTPLPVTISGYVGQSPPIFGLKGVTVSASTGETTTTDIYGYYELTLSNPWTGTISVSKANWTFSPPSQSFFNLTTDFFFC